MRFRRRRRLIPASAYYEWQDPTVGKQPWYFTPADGEPITFAGLWDEWKDKATGEILHDDHYGAERFCCRSPDRMAAILARNSFAKGALEITFAGSNPACPASQSGLPYSLSGCARTADIPAG
jgi:hypothetical protein